MAKKNLIKVKKGDEIIEISPLVLNDHKSLGWTVVGEEPAAAPEAAAPERQKESGRKRGSRSRGKKTSEPPAVSESAEE